jgi:phosphate uptake regulator
MLRNDYCSSSHSAHISVFVANSIERAADWAINIYECVVLTVTGKMEEM